MPLGLFYIYTKDYSKMKNVLLILLLTVITTTASAQTVFEQYGAVALIGSSPGEVVGTQSAGVGTAQNKIYIYRLFICIYCI